MSGLTWFHWLIVAILKSLIQTLRHTNKHWHYAEHVSSKPETYFSNNHKHESLQDTITHCITKV